MSRPAQSPLSSIYLLHIALEIPFVAQAFLAPTQLPFLDLTNTTIILLKLYASLSFASCVAALLCFPLPEFLPGKRAVAIALVVYHCSASTVLLQAPRFIPHSFGELCESFKITPESTWGTLHGLLALGFVFWWQATIGQVAAVRKTL